MTTITRTNPATHQTYSVTYNDEGAVVLDFNLRYEMVHALKMAIADKVHGDHQGYLNLLAEAEDGDVVTEDHPLADVLTYFQIADFDV